MAKLRTYTDINGIKRTLEYVKEGHFVKYHPDKEASSSSVWKLEDGSLVQIPENIWEKFAHFDDISSLINLHATLDEETLRELEVDNEKN